MRAYVEVLLSALAYPYGLAAREFGWAARWARRWAPKVELWRAAENGGGLAVDLASVSGPAWTPAGVPGALRFMENLYDSGSQGTRLAPQQVIEKITTQKRFDVKVVEGFKHAFA
jgi:hypothetical protein